ncbi:BLUF domain-containing protein [Roseateles chitinivorans]|uniref:BLUF domain-containing protein n=1 Tax=Roseateles chitinivorans TaxID=2917965 RepID=UPI003D668C6F
MLRRILYVSSMAEGMTDQVLKHIVAVAQINNRRLDITGALAIAPGVFAQVLEGPAEDIARTLARIERDERHVGLRLLLDEPIVLRLFDRWRMQLLVDDGAARLAIEATQGAAVARELLEQMRRQYTEDPHLSPAAMRGMALAS